MPNLGHVLLIRTDHLGDMLLSLPAVDVLKHADPACKVTVLASAANAEVARHHPGVDRVEVDPLQAKGSGLRGVRRLVKQIRELRCDAAVLARPTPRLALAVYLAGVPVRVGTAYRAYSFLFNRRVREHRRRPPWKHESEHTVNLLQPLGVQPVAPKAIRWRVTAAEALAAETLLRQRGAFGTRLVALHPGNAGSAMNWAPAQYAELGRRLAVRGVRLAVTGGPGERQLTALVSGIIGPAALDLGGELGLAQLAALLSRCALYVGSSTGPTHLAAALGIPVLALHSPLRSAVPGRWRPLGPQVSVLQPAIDLLCPTCLGWRCPYYHCMEKHLTVDAVEAAARAFLDAAAPPQGTSRVP